MGLGASAFIWAQAYGGKKAVPFGSLQRGERFQFSSVDGVFIKGRNGWYVDAVSGRKYRTNKKVAVLRTDEVVK
jgi:hypothetical protein